MRRLYFFRPEDFLLLAREANQQNKLVGESETQEVSRYLLSTPFTMGFTDIFTRLEAILPMWWGKRKI